MAEENLLQLTADLDDLAAIRQFVTESAEQLGCKTDAVDDMIVAFNEAVTNSIVHGYNRQAGSITVIVRRQEDKLEVCLRDDAPPFDPTAVPAPDITKPLEQRRPGGMGVHMMRHFTDNLHYCFTIDGQNELRLVKKEAFQDTA